MCLLSWTEFLEWMEMKHKTDIQKLSEMFYLTTHSTHFIYGYMASDNSRYLTGYYAQMTQLDKTNPDLHTFS